MSKSAAKNKVKPDTILKNFWKDNRRFADLFNTVLFNSDPVLKPSDLKEVDTDVSSIIKFNGHIETVQRILDVVRKTALELILLSGDWRIRKRYIMLCHYVICWQML